MPSALETLVKILKLEREQGYKNTAVIGGLGAYSQNWSQEGHSQARKPEHHQLVDELCNVLQIYEQTEAKTERHKQVAYMLDRITGRVKPNPEYLPDTPYVPPEPPPAEEKQPPSETVEVETPSEIKVADQEVSGEESHSKETRPPRRSESKAGSRRERRASEDASSPAKGERGERPRRERRSRRRAAQESTPSSGPDIPPQPHLARAPRRPRPQLSPDQALQKLDALDAPVTTIKGVGPKLSETLKEVGVETIGDMLYYLPRRYDDYTRLSPIAKLQPNTVVTIIGTVSDTTVRVGKGGRKDFALVLDDGSGLLSVTFFGQHFLVRAIHRGQQLVVSGTVTVYGNRLQMANPDWEELDNENLHTTGIVPVYPLKEGLKERNLRRLMKRAVDTWADEVPDYIPEATLERAELGDLGWALKNLHFPEGMDHLELARRRFVFDELLLTQLAVLANRREWQGVPAQPLAVDDGFLESFIAEVFPYELTGAQRHAIDEIRHDIAAPIPMNRLLQGDVGAGKTAVAVVAMAMAVAAGAQAAIMAPTGILAEQHYRNITTLFDRMPGERKPVIALMTSALTTGERESIYRGLADGSIDIAIGTHALIQEGVEFSHLGLAIVDEQHRFGVEQRKALRGKGINPHLLVMTATPIPRTFALTLYADLDLTVIDEKPAGRQEIRTRFVEPVARERVYNFVEAQLQQEHQAFVVHPLVEESDKIDAMSATEAFERLSRVFFRYKVCLLHGRMKAAEKEEVMAAFARGEYDVMVTTTVAEVGVDIPNATVMVVEDANRFGLAQLHQLRGRVGRGEYPSYCLLIAETNSPEANERLQAMEKISDGFKLAEIDWKLRGAGDIVGTRQSGRQSLKLVEEMTPDMVELAQREARTIYEEDPDLSQPQHFLLAQRVASLRHEGSDVS